MQLFGVGVCMCVYAMVLEIYSCLLKVYNGN